MPKSAEVDERSGQVAEEWILDTGTGVDVSGCVLRGKTVTDYDLPELITAAGPYQPQEITAIHLDALGGDADVLQLPPGAPNALTVGKRCATQGYEFWWKPWAALPIVRRPDGTSIEVRAENFVPFIKSLHGKEANAKQRVMVGVSGAPHSAHESDILDLSHSSVQISGDGDTTPPLPPFGPDGEQGMMMVKFQR